MQNEVPPPKVLLEAVIVGVKEYNYLTVNAKKTPKLDEEAFLGLQGILDEDSAKEDNSKSFKTKTKHKGVSKHILYRRNDYVQRLFDKDTFSRADYVDNMEKIGIYNMRGGGGFKTVNVTEKNKFTNLQDKKYLWGNGIDTSSYGHRILEPMYKYFKSFKTDIERCQDHVLDKAFKLESHMLLSAMLAGKFKRTTNKIKLPGLFLSPLLHMTWGKDKRRNGDLHKLRRQKRIEDSFQKKDKKASQTCQQKQQPQKEETAVTLVTANTCDSI